MDTDKQDDELEHEMASGAKLWDSDDVAGIVMLCSVCGFLMFKRVNRLEHLVTATCKTCQSVYTVRIELRERVEPTYKV